ncbi:protein NUCLEAR FUSION DEFECTIVE 6, chloroplastic/mitochondrial isoform X4 [Melia azedarach]|uniref:Protein NUCLEAR FUSION DEFECTIVE 6, chloroplastic/mitochondrial isoform X4 n=1 Tax=Melia azedarach TaxID=155640 RepID=A0ACC1XPY6_MELAZ|nr:protein NUCLEAR FUSION DEFECTIVE 6, chloroplastic/mitochondrial isoform X4 [Melia azedarach]
MASSCRSFICRSSLSSVKSAIRSNASKSTTTKSATSPPFSLPTRSSSSPVPRFSLSRSPSELGCVQSLLPLHSVVAAARMTSCLSTTSKSCRALSQDGIDGT